MDLFKLIGSVFVDTDEANDSLAKTDEKAKKTGMTFKDVAGKAAAVGTAVVGAAGAAMTGMVAMAKETSSSMDVIDKASQRMQVSAETYQELAYAAGMSGVQMSTLEKASKKLIGTDMSMDDALDSIYALGTAEERAAKAAELFGDNIAYELTPMLNASGPEFEAMRQEANDLGLVFDQAAVSAGATLGDAISKVESSFQALGSQLGVAIMPLVMDLMNFVLEFMPQIQGMVNLLAPVLMQLFSSLMPPMMDLARQLLPVVLDLITTLLPPLTDIITALLPLITDFLTTFMPIFVELAQAILPVVLSLIKALLPVIQLVANVIKTGLGAAINFVMPIIKQLGTIFTNVFGNIEVVAKKVLNGLIGFINGLINGLNIFLTPFRAIIAGIGKLIGAGTTMDNVKLPNIPYLAKGGVLDSGAAIVGEDGPELLSVNGARTTVTPLNSNNNAFVAIEEKLDTLIDLLTGGFGVTIDGDRMVGALAPRMNQALGRITDQERRAYA